MREIKFNVYINIGCDNVCRLNENVGFLVFGINGYWSFNSHESEDYITDSTEDDSKLVQYTGLKDSKGVEIYEGDIVNIKINCNSPGYMGNNPKHYSHTVEQVEFYNQRYITYNPNNNPGQPIKNHSPQSLRELGMRAYEYEVIGNIYENPDLLR